MISKTEAIEVLTEIHKNYPVLRPYSKDSLIVTEDQLRVLVELAGEQETQLAPSRSNSDVVLR